MPCIWRHSYHAVYEASVSVLGYPVFWVHTGDECRRIVEAVEADPQRFHWIKSQ